MKELSYSDMNSLNFYRKASDAWRNNHFINPKTNKIDTNRVMDWNVPWDFVNNDPSRGIFCTHGQDFFKMYNMVPPYCIDCWKVNVRPSTHRELIKLRNLQRSLAADDPLVWCKCGIELRPYVPALYGGYFYTNSKEAGLNRLMQVRYEVKKRIGDIPVFLKRYCTEYEIALGDTAKYKMPDNAAALEEHYLSWMSEREIAVKQADIIKLEVYQGWIDFGWKFGTDEDRSEIERTYNDGKPLHPIPRKYEG